MYGCMLVGVHSSAYELFQCSASVCVGEHSTKSRSAHCQNCVHVLYWGQALRGVAMETSSYISLLRELQSLIQTDQSGHRSNHTHKHTNT